MDSSVFLVTALLCMASVTATPTLTATPGRVVPGVTQSLTLTCRARPDARFALISSLSLFFTPDLSPPSVTPAYTKAPTQRPTTILVFNPFVVSAKIPNVPWWQGTTRPPTTEPRTTTTTITPIPTTTLQPTLPPPQKQELATVISNIIKQRVNASVAGHIGYGRNESILQVTIDSPSEFSVGQYSCRATGYAAAFLPLSDTAHRQVALHTTTTQDVVHQIRRVEAELNNMKLRWEQVDSSSAFYHSSYRGSKYLLSRGEANVNFGQFMCSVQGGYLAEVDDEDEFEFLKNFVKQHLDNESDYSEVFLGATDHGHKGDWQFLRHVNKTPFLQWGGFPSTGYDCLVLSKMADFYMNDYDCKEASRFLCEVPTN